MPWFKKDNEGEELPEEFRNLSPKEIAERLKKAQEFETELTTLRADNETRQTQFNEMQTTYNETKNRLTEIEQNARRQPQKNNDEIPSVVDDEDVAFSRRLEPTNALALHAGTMSARMSAEQQIRQMKQGNIWDKYSKEIDEIMNKETPARRIFPQTWIQAFTYVKGMHFDEVMQSATKGENLFFSETSTNVPPPPEKKEDVLTDKEAEIARKMHIDPKKYLEQKKKIQVVS